MCEMYRKFPISIFESEEERRWEGRKVASLRLVNVGVSDLGSSLADIVTCPGRKSLVWLFAAQPVFFLLLPLHNTGGLSGTYRGLQGHPRLGTCFRVQIIQVVNEALKKDKNYLLENKLYRKMPPPPDIPFVVITILWFLVKFTSFKICLPLLKKKYIFNKTK